MTSGFPFAEIVRKNTHILRGQTLVQIEAVTSLNRDAMGVP